MEEKNWITEKLPKKVEDALFRAFVEIVDSILKFEIVPNYKFSRTIGSCFNIEFDENDIITGFAKLKKNIVDRIDKKITEVFGEVLGEMEIKVGEGTIKISYPTNYLLDSRGYNLDPEKGAYEVVEK